MSVLEQEIIQKFQQLESDAKQRILQALTNTMETSFDYNTWWAEIETLQSNIQARLADSSTIGTLSLLDELREEAS